MQTVTMETLKETKIDVFEKFSEQMALVTAGTIDHFNTMTIGWGMMGNVWGHTPGVTVYVSPNRYTWEKGTTPDGKQYYSIITLKKEEQS